MSNLTDSVNESPRGNMSFALVQATEALGFAYSNTISYQGPKPDDMAAMRATADRWIEKQQFLSMKSDAIANLKSRSGLGNDSGVQALIAEIERSQNPAELQGALNAIERVSGSAERLASEVNDPEVASLEQRSAMHNYFYANDAIYRENMNRLLAESDAQAAAFQQQMRPLNQWAEANNVTTSVDDQIADYNRRIAAAQAQVPPDSQTIIGLRAAAAPLEQQRIQELGARGAPPELVTAAGAAAGINRATTNEKDEQAIGEYNGALQRANSMSRSNVASSFVGASTSTNARNPDTEVLGENSANGTNNLVAEIPDGSPLNRLAGLSWNNRALNTNTAANLNNVEVPQTQNAAANSVGSPARGL